MAKYINDWLKEDFNKLKDLSFSESMMYHFMRDDRRGVFSDFEFIKSPADGVVLYVKVLESPSEVVEVKGVEYSFIDYIGSDVLLSELVFPLSIIGIFMTYVDVHINRAPISGYLTYYSVDYISSYNYPMLFTEDSILVEGKLDLSNVQYLYNNDRVISVFNNPFSGVKLYLMQIADYNVNSITPFIVRQRSFVNQGSRFSMIRYGSQVDVILPSSVLYDYEFVVSKGYHILAGVDSIVKLNRKG